MRNIDQATIDYLELLSRRAQLFQLKTAISDGGEKAGLHAHSLFPMPPLVRVAVWAGVLVVLVRLPELTLVLWWADVGRRGLLRQHRGWRDSDGVAAPLAPEAAQRLH